MHFSQNETLLLTLPFVSLLAAWFFHIDERMFESSSSKNEPRRPRFANFDDSNHLMMDPDGRISSYKPRGPSSFLPEPLRHIAPEPNHDISPELFPQASAEQLGQISAEQHLQHVSSHNEL